MRQLTLLLGLSLATCVPLPEHGMERSMLGNTNDRPGMGLIGRKGALKTVKPKVVAKAKPVPEGRDCSSVIKGMDPRESGSELVCPGTQMCLKVERETEVKKVSERGRGLFMDSNAYRWLEKGVKTAVMTTLHVVGYTEYKCGYMKTTRKKKYFPPGTNFCREVAQEEGSGMKSIRCSWWKGCYGYPITDNGADRYWRRWKATKAGLPCALEMFADSQHTKAGGGLE